MSTATYYERNRDVILNRAKDYYQNNKELLREGTKKKYRELPENEKDVKRQYQRYRYHNMTSEEKQKLKEITINKKITVRLERQQHEVTDIFS